MVDVAFLEVSPGRVVATWDRLESFASRPAGRTAFYLPDYFLEESDPWVSGRFCEELSFAEFLNHLDLVPPSLLPDVEWRSPSQGDYVKLFESAQAFLAAGHGQKIVPVIFEHGQLKSSLTKFAAHLVRKALEHPPGLRAYGWIQGERGFVGATPELLVESVDENYSTMALAGTRPLDKAEELLADAKEQLEHQLVVRDIGERLARFGELRVGPTELARFPKLAHLCTRLELLPHERSSRLFGDLVRTLHPTAALGAWPRSQAALDWLRAADRRVARGRFGAPFAVERDGGAGSAAVAIRGIDWQGERIRLGSGSGVLRESQLDHEWSELKNKRDQVKSLLL